MNRYFIYIFASFFQRQAHLNLFLFIGVLGLSVSVFADEVQANEAETSVQMPTAKGLEYAPFTQTASGSCVGLGSLSGDVYGNQRLEMDINVSESGTLKLSGTAMEGHPNMGCSESGNTPGDGDMCTQFQNNESFVVNVNGIIGTYNDSGTATKENFYKNVSFSTNISAGSHTIKVRHNDHGPHSVGVDLDVCFESDSVPSPTTTNTPTPSSGPPALSTPTPTPSSGAPPSSPPATNTPSATATPVPPTATATNTPTPTPILVDMAIRMLPDGGNVQLSDFVDIKAQVKNFGPNPAQNPTVDVSIPAGLSNITLTSHGGWSCSISGTSVRCTRTSYSIDAAWSDVVTINARVPGTYLANTVAGTGIVDNDHADPNWFNNSDNYDIDVEKVWSGSDSTIPNPKLFTHVRYSNKINGLTVTEADFEANEVIVNPFQVELDVAIGTHMDSRPYITTEFCLTNPTSIGCDLDSDRIYGVLRLNSYDIEEFALVNISTLVDEGADLVASSTLVSINGGDGRFAEADPADCQSWKPLISSSTDCVAKVFPFPSSWALAEQAIYEWDDAEYTQILLFSEGGRNLTCSTDVAACIESDSAKPGHYRGTGSTNYQYIFVDQLNRITSSPYIVDRTADFTFFTQFVAPFVEQD
ncbi:MAG: hypothetical protein AAGD96_01210 [Chloroflexota bacterium]